MATKITRREWAVVLGAVASPAASVQSQTLDTQSEAGLMAEARAELALELQRISTYPLPAATEPAFLFKP
jgi:hypothetical protein